MLALCFPIQNSCPRRRRSGGNVHITQEVLSQPPLQIQPTSRARHDYYKYRYDRIESTPCVEHIRDEHGINRTAGYYHVRGANKSSSGMYVFYPLSDVAMDNQSNVAPSASSRPPSTLFLVGACFNPIEHPNVNQETYRGVMLEKLLSIGALFRCDDLFVDVGKKSTHET